LLVILPINLWQMDSIFHFISLLYFKTISEYSFIFQSSCECSFWLFYWVWIFFYPTQKWRERFYKNNLWRRKVLPRIYFQTRRTRFRLPILQRIFLWCQYDYIFVIYCCNQWKYFKIEHKNFVSVVPFPIVVSIEEKKPNHRKAIIRTIVVFFFSFLPLLFFSSLARSKNHCSQNRPKPQWNLTDFAVILKEFLWVILILYSRQARFTEVKNHQDSVKDLVKLEQMLLVTHYKFGVLYCGPNQHDEDTIYSNSFLLS